MPDNVSPKRLEWWLQCAGDGQVEPEGWKFREGQAEELRSIFRELQASRASLASLQAENAALEARVRLAVGIMDANLWPTELDWMGDVRDALVPATPAPAEPPPGVRESEEVMRMGGSRSRPTDYPLVGQQQRGRSERR